MRIRLLFCIASLQIDLLAYAAFGWSISQITFTKKRGKTPLFVRLDYSYLYTKNMCIILQ
jgi:hypothetical protein